MFKAGFNVLIANIAVFSAITSWAFRKRLSNSPSRALWLSLVVALAFFVFAGCALIDAWIENIQNVAMYVFVFLCPYSFAYAWYTRLERDDSKRARIAFTTSAFFMIVWLGFVLLSLLECAALVQRIL